MIKIKSFIPFSLIDYPSLVSCVIFLGGCNFRCPWCHNFELVDEKKLEKIEDIPLEDFFSFLDKKNGKIDGVCISGGEPTINGDYLIELTRKIKNKNYLVKLDTNGSNPEIIKELIEKNLIDFVAIDIKNKFDKYPETIGLKTFDTDKIISSLDILKKSKIKFQARTTLVNNLVERSEMEVFSSKLGIKLIFQDYRKV